MRVDTLRPTPENTLTGDTTPNYPPKGRKLVEANKGFYRKHGIKFRFSPYIRGHDGLMNPDGSPITRNVSRERAAIQTYLEGHDVTYRTSLDVLSKQCLPMDLAPLHFFVRLMSTQNLDIDIL